MFTKFEKLKKIHSLNVTIMYNYEQGEFWENFIKNIFRSKLIDGDKGLRFKSLDFVISFCNVLNFTYLYIINTEKWKYIPLFF